MILIVYTKTDETPAMATYSLLPIVTLFTHNTGIDIQTKDLSLSARILSLFPEVLSDSQNQEDDLAELGRWVKHPEANIIKLPNISASTSQLKAAVKELQSKGYPLPDYPDHANTPEEEAIKFRYDKVKGSAVNPVLREGNSDRRAPKPVKAYVRKHPHHMGSWSKEAKAHVASMNQGDFKSNERSLTISREQAGEARIEFIEDTGHVTVLKPSLSLIEGEVIDATFMSKKALNDFLEHQMTDAKRQDLLFSVHLKATMMKISDPIIFGCVVKAYFKDFFQKHETLLAQLNINPNNGLAELYSKIETLSQEQQEEIAQDLRNSYANRSELAMVDSDKGLTNLHVPSDVIVDASMPAMIRNSGKMWNAQGQLQETKAVIPDGTYAGVYSEVINFCKVHGAFDPKTMGSVSNIGLMAQKAEEYGSHDKTFECPEDGIIKVISASEHVLLEHRVEQGDIWRMCQVKDIPIRDWVALAVSRARATGTPAVFWLDQDRAHDAQLIKKVKTYLSEHDTQGLDLRIMSPLEATQYSCERLKMGQDTISVTGNVLRDYLTDLFPIMELGTSAKMLSIVPLLNGGRLFETGAGGSAPRMYKRFLEGGHLGWDSLGEFMSLAASLEHVASAQQQPKIKILSETLNQAIGKLLEENKSPSSRPGGTDTRTSHFYLAMYWAEALVKQTENTQLKDQFAPLLNELVANEQKIVSDIENAQTKSVHIGGYYHPSEDLAFKVMRPSATFNQILEQHKQALLN